MSSSERSDFRDYLFANDRGEFIGIPADLLKNSEEYFQAIAKCNIGWDVIIAANFIFLDQSFVKMYRGLIPVVLFIMILAGFFTSLISARLNHRFRVLRRKIDYISQWDLTQNLRMDGNDEFKLLGDSLENTKQRILGLITQINNINELKRTAEISALRAQINSHFLFNALSSIKWLARYDDKKALAEAVDKLAIFLRYSLSLEENQVPLSSEIEHLNAYIYLQKQRYHDEVNIHTDIDSELLSCRTVKLILQPLVENSIYHGRRENGSPLNISIYTYFDDQSYTLVVEDDGNGMSEERIQEILKGNNDVFKSSFGLKNVITRLQLCSNGLAEFKVESKPDTFTKISICQSRANDSSAVSIGDPGQKIND